MTGRIDGTPWTHPSGITIDAPADALIGAPADLLQWADQIGMPLVLTDIWVSRRMRCSLLVDHTDQSVTARTTVRDILDLALLRGHSRVYIVEQLTDDRLTGRAMGPPTQHDRG